MVCEDDAEKIRKAVEWGDLAGTNELAFWYA